MKRLILFLTVGVVAALGGVRAQNIVIGQKAPDLKNIVWVEGRVPALADLTCLVFLHTAGNEEVLRSLKALSDQQNGRLRVIVVTQEPMDVVAPVVRPYLSPRFGTAVDTDKKALADFGIQYLPFSVLTDAKNKVQWMGNPQSLNSSFISKIQ